jgi:hypothetical protein
MKNNKSMGEGFLASISYFGAWIITAAGAIIDLLAIREAIVALLAIFRVVSLDAYHRAGNVGQDIFTGFGITAFDNVMLLILGCAAIVFIVWVEYYFRKGRPLGLLYKRIAKVAIIELAVMILSVVIATGAGLIINNMA